MADLRIPPTVPSTALRPAARTEAARAAQRAFFQTAITPQTQLAPVKAEVRPASAPVDPQRPLRPGSLLDIKV